jgi:hypothetical protein
VTTYIHPRVLRNSLLLVTLLFLLLLAAAILPLFAAPAPTECGKSSRDIAPADLEGRWQLLWRDSMYIIHLACEGRSYTCWQPATDRVLVGDWHITEGNVLCVREDCMTHHEGEDMLTIQVARHEGRRNGCAWRARLRKVDSRTFGGQELTAAAPAVRLTRVRP